MISAPASDMPHTLPGRNRAIGLFLARLLAYLLRLHLAGRTSVRADIAAMICSAHFMVHSVIRNRAAAQLKAAGCLNEARALRSNPGELAPAASPTQTEPATPAELIERLQTTIDIFERAEAKASALVCMMLCVYCFMTPWQRRPRLHTGTERSPTIQKRGVGLSPLTAIAIARGPPAFSPTIPNLIWDPCQSAGKMPGGSAQAWIVRRPIDSLDRLVFSALPFAGIFG